MIPLRREVFRQFIQRSKNRIAAFQMQRKVIEVKAMISNQILQSTIDGLKSITRKELSVVEKEAR